MADGLMLQHKSFGQHRLPRPILVTGKLLETVCQLFVSAIFSCTVCYFVLNLTYIYSFFSLSVGHAANRFIV